MNRIFIFLWFILLKYQYLYSQNLVLNPSFETMTSCGGISNFDQIVTDWTIPWINLSGDTCSTTDAYHACNPLGALGPDVPDNIRGSQLARTGNAYAGIITYEAMSMWFSPCTPVSPTGWREYVEGQLSSPLIAGNTYCVSFYVSLSDQSKWSTGDFHVYLSNTPLSISCAAQAGSSSDLSSQGINPQLRYDGATIDDKVNWVRLEWNYTATGGEQYITIGNFDPDGNTNVNCVDAGSIDPYGYYYIEDVSVVFGNCVPLPVELAYFKGKWNPKSQSIQFEWGTLKEINTSHFILYQVHFDQLTNQLKWVPITTIPAKGFSNSLERYTWDYFFNRFGVHRFDLAQFDLNGTRHDLGSILVYVHPDYSISSTSNYITIHGRLDQLIQVELISLTGKIIKICTQKELIENEGKIKISSIPKGVYIIRLISKKGQIYSYKLFLTN